MQAVLQCRRRATSITGDVRDRSKDFVKNKMCYIIDDGVHVWWEMMEEGTVT
jgi:hypothetical protein